MIDGILNLRHYFSFRRQVQLYPLLRLESVTLEKTVMIILTIIILKQKELFRWIYLYV